MLALLHVACCHGQYMKIVLIQHIFPLSCFPCLHVIIQASEIFLNMSNQFYTHMAEIYRKYLNNITITN